MPENSPLPPNVGQPGRGRFTASLYATMIDHMRTQTDFAGWRLHIGTVSPGEAGKHFAIQPLIQYRALYSEP